MSLAKKILIIIINKPVKKENLFGETLSDSHLPINTPTRLELINAIELPIKTIIGFPDSADNVRVAIWVLSPSSAINMVVNVVIKIVENLFSSFFSSLSKFIFIFLIQQF